MNRVAPLLLSLLGLVAAACASSPAIPLNRHGLPVVDSIELYERLVDADPRQRLVDLETAIPDARFDIRYATTDNFMKVRLYPVARAFLRAPAAEALANVQAELARSGLGLKIFDAYRPYRVTEAMWEPFKDPDYVADPARGSRHNRGAAVDLTLVDLATGRELEMPTGYDDFTPRAGHGFDDLPATVLGNRRTLREVMERHGFTALSSEWWHYDFGGWEEFPLMNIELDAL